jgi:dimethylargininase
VRATQAIVRPPGPNFAKGLTTSTLGPPAYELALEQHERYCVALEQCGLTLTHLKAESLYPDATFVEDTAVLTRRGAMLAKPGAESRTGEVANMQRILARFYPALPAIRPPGTLEGGDVCEADGRFFVGLSERTNEEGVRQLAEWLDSHEYACSCIDLRGLPGLLHLKSGLAYVGDGRLAVIDALADHPAFDGYKLIRVPADEEYAANCVKINETVLVAEGHPGFTALLRDMGLHVKVLNVSEFQKMDGGLSCLSLRF